MGVRVNPEVSSIFARRQVERTNRSILSNQEQLSSLLRINRAADDAAGLAIAERFSSQVREINQEVNSFQSGINLAQTAEGGLEVQSDAVGRIRELAVQAANGTLNDDQRDAINAEAQELLQEIDATANNTEFNGVSPLNNGNQQVALDASGGVDIEFDESTVNSLNLDTVDLSTQAGASAALDALDNAQTQINTNRANIGAQQNGLSATIEEHSTSALNLQEAESRIRDVDVARAFIEKTRNDVLLQGGLSALIQGRSQSQTALSLLNG